MTLNITRRTAVDSSISLLASAGVHPLLARVYAARGVSTLRELVTDVIGLIPVAQLHNAERMASILADAIAAQQRLLIVADYDSDGATACAVGIRALRAFGAEVDYLVPNRFEYGYGLTPEITMLAKALKSPDILITVDNGIASVEGVAIANELGMRVLITDHHLPGPRLPDALCIVNPNQPDCTFPSKNLAGVGVMFYVMLALRAELRKRGWFGPDRNLPEPNLSALLDLVALGTVADVVRLDENNRILVQQGLKRMRGGRTWPGIAALMRVAGRDLARISVEDLGFVMGPRLNAAGRLDDMSIGIECLICDDEYAVDKLARQLDALNRERRAIESDMQDGAFSELERTPPDDAYSVCLFDPTWHEGVVGILASRIKERWQRPVFAFARSKNGEIKGSGRSIRALHLRDVLDIVAKHDPGLLIRFGGHAAAAGLTLREFDLERFRAAFEAAVRSQLSPADLERVIETDGSLKPAELTLEAAKLLEQQVWGQGFAAPVFDDDFIVQDQRIVGQRHLKLRVSRENTQYDAILFSQCTELPTHVHLVYRPTVNYFNGTQQLQITVEHWQAV